MTCDGFTTLELLRQQCYDTKFNLTFKPENIEGQNETILSPAALLQ